MLHESFIHRVHAFIKPCPEFTPVIGFDDAWRPVEARGFLYHEDGVKFPNDRAEPRQRHVLATRVMSNGVEVIVANDKTADSRSKLLRIMNTQDTTTLAPSTVKNNVRMTVAPEDQARNNHTSPIIHPHPRQQQSLLSSSTSTNFELEPYVPFHRKNTEMLPQRHNFVIKTCYTTYTYLTTTIQQMRTMISTYETVVSTITTEPINFATATVDVQPTQHQLFQATKSVIDTPVLQPKIEKRIDEMPSNHAHDVIEPSEVANTHSCSMTSCPCTVTLTESLKDNLRTKLVDDVELDEVPLQLKRSPFKPTKYSSTIIDTAPTLKGDYKKDRLKHKPENRPSSAPSEKVIQKYTEIINDENSKKNDKNKLKNNAPNADSDKINNRRNATKPADDKRRPNVADKNKEPQKNNKNKFEVADLIKLGSLGIKRLAPMIEQMTGSLIKRQEQNKQTTTIKPATKLTPYVVNKRVDDIMALGPEHKSGGSQFPIYIPVDEKDIETSESQNIYYNSTLQQNLAWNSHNNNKNSRTNSPFNKPIHESPLLNGGIPISPGEIITANSDVIVGKPAVGGPNIGHINKPNIPINNEQQQNYQTDSHSQASDFHDVRAKPPPRGQGLKQIPFIRDDSYDLRPPMMSMPRPQQKEKHHQQNVGQFNAQNQHNQVKPHNNGENYDNQKFINGQNDQHKPHSVFVDHIGGTIHSADSLLDNHGRPAFLDYIPALDSPASYQNYIKNNLITRKTHDDESNPQNSLDKSKPKQDAKHGFANQAQTQNKNVKDAPEPIVLTDLAHKSTIKPFLVDIQPSRVANVIIPHGSTQALIFSGSSEPHKNGEYIDDPLPYPEPGYFGSFSIDAPHLTSVHVGGTIPLKPNGNNKQQSFNNHPGNKDIKPPHGQVWKFDDAQHKQVPMYHGNTNFGKLPPPISNQESNMQFGPHFVLRKPDNNGPSTNMNPPPINKNQYFNNNMNKNIKTTTSDYESDLAVPPPPPPALKSNQDYKKLNNGEMIGRPQFNMNQDVKNQNFHTQHIPFQHQNNDQPKITSEVYFASTASQGDRGHNAKPFTFNIPANSNYNNRPVLHGNNYENTNFDGGLVTLNAGTKVNIPNVSKPNINVNPNNNNHYNIPQGGGLITLNAGASVFNPNLPEQTISGINIPQANKHHAINNNVRDYHNLHNVESTGIPIGTNFAIKVEPQVIQEYNPNGAIGSVGVSTADFKPHEKGPEIIIGGNSWKAGISDNDDNSGISDSVHNGNQKVHIVHANNVKFNNYDKPKNNVYNVSSIVNSQTIKDNAFNNQNKFTNKFTTPKQPSFFKNETIKQRPIVLQTANQNKNQFAQPPQLPKPIKFPNDPKPPPKREPQQVAQSNYFHPDTTTHKIIPLTFDFDAERYGINGGFGQKLPSQEQKYNNWQQQPVLNPKEKHVTPNKNLGEFMAPPPLTTTTYNPAYIPSNYNSNKQPVYNIPTRDNYDVTKSTFKPLNTTKQGVYVSSNVYKTIDESDYVGNGEFPMESMKVPVLTSTPHTLSNEVSINFRPLKNNTSRDEILIGSGNDYIHYTLDKNKHQYNAQDNTGSQTEKPFDENKYKEISLVTLPGVRQTTQPAYNPPTFSQMVPRPFSVSDNNNVKINANTYENNKPRPFQKTKITKEDANKMSLNIGEVSAKPTARPIADKPQATTQKIRPQISIKNNSTTYKSDINKIITSSVNIVTNNPLTVLNVTTEKSLPTFTINIPSRNNDSSTMAASLTPPPPTKDYNYNPSGSDDSILGMSPPPKTTSTKLPVKEYTKHSDISTFRPGYNTVKNQYKRPGDYYRITYRPYNRYTTPSTPILTRPKVTPGTTVTRIVFPSRSTVVPSWRNPTRSETRPTPDRKTKTPSIINSTPVATVGSDIMHPDVYPEETVGMNISPSKPIITPDKVQTPIVFPTVAQQSKHSHSTITQPSAVRVPSIIQASENFLNENAIRQTEVLKVASTAREEIQSKKPIRTLSHKFSIPSVKTSASSIEQPISLKPVHHAGNEIQQSDDEPSLLSPETAITFTTTLAQPASTVMTTRFVTLTHTLTVTQTKTSLVSPVVGSTTQTLVLTNTQTSTVVDVVTEIHTLVQPTTIVQTITKHVSITTLPSWETKYPKVPIEPTQVRDHPYRTKEVIKLDDVSLSSDEDDLIIMPDNTTADVETNDTIHQGDEDTFFVVMNKSQNGGSGPTIQTVHENAVDPDEATRNEEVGNDGVSHVLLGEILLAGTPFLETPHAVSPTGVAYGKECQPDCKASRNERCQRMHGIMKCVCRPGFARMFPDRPCKPTYTYSMKLALSRYGNERLLYQDSFGDQNSQEFQDLAMATHEGINRMVMQSDLRDVYHGVHINGFQPVKIPMFDGRQLNGVMNDFYVQLSDNAHETRLKEVIEKYLRNNNYSLGGTNVYAAGELVDKFEVGDFNECMSGQFHDCSEHAECFNLRATYTCSCREGYADLSVNSLYPGRICSAEPVGCEKCHYHGTCYTRDDSRILCECFQWYAGESCHINLKVILISLATLGAILFTLLLICLIMTCAKRRRPKSHIESSRRSQAPPNVMTSCIGNIPAIHQGSHQSSKMHPTLDKRALIQERGNESGGEGSSIHNVSLPYIPAKKVSQISHKSGKKLSLTDDLPSKEKKPFTLMIPRAKYHPAPATTPLMISSNDIRDSNIGGKRKSSGESSNETKLLSYLDAGPSGNDITRRKQSNESSYSIHKGLAQKYSTGALVSAGFKVSTTVMGGIDHDSCLKDIPDDESSIAKSNTIPTLDMQSQFNSLRKAYSQEDINDWTDAERRIGELTMSEARSFDGTLVKPSTKLLRSTTGSNKSSAHYTQHEANTMAERDLGSTFLLPHVHLYKPDMGSDVSEFDSL